MTGNELWEKANRLIFAKAKKNLSHLVERRGTSTPLFAEVCQSCRIVGVNRYRLTPKVRQEATGGKENSQELALIDRKFRAKGRPQA